MKIFVRLTDPNLHGSIDFESSKWDLADLMSLRGRWVPSPDGAPGAILLADPQAEVWVRRHVATMPELPDPDELWSIGPRGGIRRERLDGTLIGRPDNPARH